MDYTNAADKVKDDLTQSIKAAISAYQQKCPESVKHFARKSKLSVEGMITLLLSMQGGSLKKELHELGAGVTASAFVQRRKHISSMLMEDVLEHFNAASDDNRCYKGYRVLAIDGTTVNMARNPNSPCFVQDAGHPEGICQMHVNPLYDVLNKTYVHCVIQPQPRQDEVGALAFMLAWYDFPKKTLIVADRGYESYNIIGSFLELGVDFLIRVRQSASAMREIKKLPMTELDTRISVTITTTQTNADKAGNYVYIQTRKKGKAYSPKTRAGRWDHPSPFPMSFRVIRTMLDTGEYETLITSLPDTISAAEIKELYHARWGIETAFRELKYGLGLTNLHGKQDDFVRQEIYASMIMANFCNRIAREVVIQQKKSNVHEYAVNGSMAIYLCKKFFRTKGASGQQLMKDVGRYTEPIRPGRRDERNLRAKGFAGFIYRVAA